VERTHGCELPPVPETASGTSASGLAAAWREAAERGRPTCVLMARESRFVVGWVNRSLSRLLGRDSTDVVGRPLADLCRSFEAGGSGGDGDPENTAGPIDWAELAERLACSGGGSGPGILRGIDGTAQRVHLSVSGVDVPVPKRLIPAQGRHRLASSTDEDVENARYVRGRRAVPREQGRYGAGVVPAGVIGELPFHQSAKNWLVEVEPVDDVLADVEAALADAENRFAALAGCAPVGIFVSDAGMRLGYVNDQFVQLTGTPASALLGNAWLDLVHGEDLSSLYSAVQAVLEGTAVELSIRLATERGAPRWLHLRLAPTTTPSRSAGFIGTAEDVTERRLWEEHLTYQAWHDSLTGLVNRRRLIEVLSDLLSDRRGLDRRCAVLFVDLDGFKEVNDRFGHDVGDRVLVEVAHRFQRVSRDTDVLARIAGDEFVVVLRHVQSEVEAEAAARRHLAALTTPIRLGAQNVVLTASVGIAVASAKDTPESLLRRADRVMYEAKEAGHGLYRLASAITSEDTSW
jgi:diguanylate cyclase (GGDEF)-like protein/PAS domain S-box-containing protein